MTPLVSVIIPTIGRPALLGRAIRSVMAQSIANFEVLVVVDGPDEATIRLLTDLTDVRLRVMQNAHSMGSAEARNVGLRAARGDWIAFLDDDDEWLENKLALQMAELSRCNENRDVIVSSLYDVVTPLRRYVWPRRVYDNASSIAEYLFDRRTWLRGDTMLQCSSLLMSRQLALDVRFQSPHDDWDMLLRAANSANLKVVTVNQPLVTHYTEEARPSLGANFDWRTSLAWADANRQLMSDRAYAGFCLTVIGPQAAKTGDRSAFFLLLQRALRRGSPRLLHLAFYLAVWLVPMHSRQAIRSLLYRPSAA